MYNVIEIFFYIKIKMNKYISNYKNTFERLIFFVYMHVVTVQHPKFINPPLLIRIFFFFCKRI